VFIIAGLFATVDDLKPRVVHIEFPALPTLKLERMLALAENGSYFCFHCIVSKSDRCHLDAFLSSIIDLFPTTRYTVLYTTTPVSAEGVHILHVAGQGKKQQLFSSSLHAQKRGFMASEDGSLPSPGESSGDSSLFDKYQFFTPGRHPNFSCGVSLLTHL
jgi:hypothetical protein